MPRLGSTIPGFCTKVPAASSANTASTSTRATRMNTVKAARERGAITSPATAAMEAPP